MWKNNVPYAANPSNRTNVPDIAMCYSDSRFPYGPFVPHYVPRQYIETYFSGHKTDSDLVLNTTVEDLSRILTLPQVKQQDERFCRWKLTLRKFDAVRKVDVWWEEEFDAVILANGHYSVPYVRNPPANKHMFPREDGKNKHVGLNIISLGPPRQKPPRIHLGLSKPHRPLQNLPHPLLLHIQKGPCHRKLGLWT